MADERDKALHQALKKGGWKFYDVPVTYSVFAPSSSAATSFVANQADVFTRKAALDSSPAYRQDHAFVDGSTRVCECVGH